MKHKYITVSKFGSFSENRMEVIYHKIGKEFKTHIDGEDVLVKCVKNKKATCGGCVFKNSIRGCIQLDVWNKVYHDCCQYRRKDGLSVYFKRSKQC